MCPGIGIGTRMASIAGLRLGLSTRASCSPVVMVAGRVIFSLTRPMANPGQRGSAADADAVQNLLDGFRLRSAAGPCSVPGSIPVSPVEAAVLHGLGEVLGADLLPPVEVGDGAGGLQNPIVGPSAEAHAPHGHLEGAFAGLVEAAVRPEMRAGNVGVVKAARSLPLPGGLDALPEQLGAGGRLGPAKIFVRHGRHFDMQVDAVEHRPADLGQVALDDPRRTPALPRGVAVEPARTSVQISTDTSPKREHFGPQPIDNTETCNDSKRLTRVQVPKTVPPP